MKFSRILVAAAAVTLLAAGISTQRSWSAAPANPPSNLLDFLEVGDTVTVQSDTLLIVHSEEHKARMTRALTVSWKTRQFVVLRHAIRDDGRHTERIIPVTAIKAIVRTQQGAP